MNKAIAKKLNFGFTLVEIGIVLLIAAAIIYAAISLFSNKREEAVVTQETSAIAQFISSVQKAKQFGAIFTQFSHFVDAKVFPAHWVVSGNNVGTALGNTGIGFLPTEYHMNIILSNPSKKICIELASSLAQNKNIGTIWAGNASGVDQVKYDYGQLNYTTLTNNCNSPSRVAFNFSIAPR